MEVEWVPYVRVDLREARDTVLPTLDEMVKVTAAKVVTFVPVSREAQDDALPPFEELIRMAEERDREFRALPAGEQARILAERAAAYEAERCPTCGHHPDDDC